MDNFSKLGLFKVHSRFGLAFVCFSCDISIMNLFFLNIRLAYTFRKRWMKMEQI